MNPYDFVRIDWNQPVVRRAAPRHDRFDGGLCGRIEGAITALTPIFLPATADVQREEALRRARRPLNFAANGNNQYILPGSSLKGLIRSVVETVGPGCWWLYDGVYRSRDGHKDIPSNYSDRLPRPFQQCAHADGLCVACRLFGLIKGGTLLLGSVNFDDAVCVAPVEHRPIYTPILDNPKARHSAWYLSRDGRTVAGRKFFFHFPPGQLNVETEFKRTNQGVHLNRYLRPLDAGTRFEFSVSFSNIAADDWPVLLYALALERETADQPNGVRHKFGYAKPAGLGSIDIELTRLTLIDPVQRYRRPGAGTSVYAGAELHDYLQNQLRKRFLQATSVTLQDLRRIWGWPAPEGVSYQYPGQSWFRDNPNAPLSAAP